MYNFLDKRGEEIVLKHPSLGKLKNGIYFDTSGHEIILANCFYGWHQKKEAGFYFGFSFSHTLSEWTFLASRYAQSDSKEYLKRVLPRPKEHDHDTLKGYTHELGTSIRLLFRDRRSAKEIVGEWDEAIRKEMAKFSKSRLMAEATNLIQAGKRLS